MPHFELVFYLTIEALGKLHPSQRIYSQWDQMEEKERRLHRAEIARIHVETAERFEHSAIFIHPNPGTEDETLRLIDLIREQSGDRFFLMLHGDATYGIPDGKTMEEFSLRLVDEPQKLKVEAEANVKAALERAEHLHKHGGLGGRQNCGCVKHRLSFRGQDVSGPFQVWRDAVSRVRAFSL